MNTYKHKQIGYLILIVTLAVLVFFVSIYIMASLEPASVDSGANFLITTTMALVVFILLSFSTLNVSIDESYIKVKFGYGIFQKKILLQEISSIKTVKNKWYYGFGIRLWLWPTMWIFNVSGLDAVELTMKNGKIYRIGTDEPAELNSAIKQAANLS